MPSCCASNTVTLVREVIFMPNAEEKRQYTYGDLLAMEDGDRYELYDGELVPVKADSIVHDAVHSEIKGLHLKGKTCRVFGPNCGVRLFDEKDDPPELSKLVVKPDIMVVCDPDKVTGKDCRGAPDLVVEILSESNMQNDINRKFLLYQRAGVKEYWLVNPATKSVTVHLREGDRFSKISYLYQQDDPVPVTVLNGFMIEMKTAFSYC